MDSLTKEQKETWDKLKYVPEQPLSGHYTCDGTRLTLTLPSGRSLYYSLSTPYDISTATKIWAKN